MQTWAITDPGNIREQNQDAYAVINFGHLSLIHICSATMRLWRSCARSHPT